MIEPRPAATVMIARDRAEEIELFLLRRSARSAFMPDVFVFPGGAVDTTDGGPVARARLRGSTQPLDPAYVYAAARETFEEAGLLFCRDAVDVSALRLAREQLLGKAATFAQILDGLGTAVDAAALHYFSRWITPPGEVRRFDAHFFVARAPLGQTAQADAVETHDGVWVAPRAALERYAAGELALMFPTLKHLERLCAFTRVADLLGYASRKAIHPVMPAAGENAQYVLPAGLDGLW